MTSFKFNLNFRNGENEEVVETGGKKFDKEHKGRTAFSFSALSAPGSDGNSELYVEFSMLLLLHVR